MFGFKLRFMRYSHTDLWLLAVSFILACLIVIFDYLIGTDNIDLGIIQLSGVIICGILMLFALRRIFFPHQLVLEWVLIFSYLAGLLIVGLKGGVLDPLQSDIYLDHSNFNLIDTFINILGFLPLGFLLSAALSGKISQLKTGLTCFAVGAFISLLIETMQFCCVAGRYSSLYDLIANAFGTLFGYFLFLVYAVVSGLMVKINTSTEN